MFLLLAYMPAPMSWRSDHANDVATAAAKNKVRKSAQTCKRYFGMKYAG
jgi:hypothetical protein